MTREPIYAALFALVSAATGIVTSSRRLRSFADVSSAECPALFMTQHTETQAVQTKIPGRWTLHVELAVFVNTGANDPNIVPVSVLNPILDCICTTLVPPAPLAEQTLGGLVARCRIAGAIEIVEGVQDSTALAVIPVEIYLPD